MLLSCTKNLDDYNINSKAPRVGDAPPEMLFSNAEINLARLLATPDVNTNIFRLLVQHWTETTYTDESNYDLVTRQIPDNFWTIIYRDVLMDLKEAKSLIEKTDPKFTDPDVIKNQKAIVDLLQVYAYSMLVDTFGNVPYSESLDISNLNPKYDDAASIYADLHRRLDEDIAALVPGKESFKSSDLIYKGNVAKWILFANSLKLKLGMTIADVDPAQSKKMVEEAAAQVFQSAADNAALVFLDAPPNTSPIWENLVQSKRKDFVVANTLVDQMNILQDPRRPLYFTQVEGQYKGGIYGSLNTYSDFSKVNPKITVQNYESLLLSNVEVEFYLAEAVERGYQVPGTAEEHYQKAISESILYWGGTEADVTAYLAKPEVAYASAAGDFRQKIGFQKWIALFNRGFQAWTEWRRLDAPKLNPPDAAGRPIPLRYTYPNNEVNLNKVQLEAAAAAMGGDKTTTRIFWDKQ